MAGERTYIAALKLLARRELSEAQVRQRLTRRGYDSSATDAAIARLIEERALDDDRVAAAIARTEVGLKHRGRLRVQRKIEQAGIAPAIARRAIAATFGAIDEGVLLETSLARRLPAGTWIESDRQFQKLGRYLAGQGFDPTQILQALSIRRRRGD